MVSESEPVRIIVEITRAEPLRGTIAEHDRPIKTFNGWTAFASAIASAVRRITPPAPNDGADGAAGG